MNLKKRRRQFRRKRSQFEKRKRQFKRRKKWLGKLLTDGWRRFGKFDQELEWWAGTSDNGGRLFICNHPLWCIWFLTIGSQLRKVTRFSSQVYATLIAHFLISQGHKEFNLWKDKVCQHHELNCWILIWYLYSRSMRECRMPYSQHWNLHAMRCLIYCSATAKTLMAFPIYSVATISIESVPVHSYPNLPTLHPGTLLRSLE